MKKGWAPTQEAFDSLLNWLDPDRDVAGRKYETIRVRLIKIFVCRGCGEADELADECINRVTSKVQELAKTYEGEPSLYFYGVANKLVLEYSRRTRMTPEMAALPPPADESDIEAYQCLDECMKQLSTDIREMLLRYYQDERQAKIDNRKQLARELGIGVNALRIRAHRNRIQLQQCVESCLEHALVH